MYKIKEHDLIEIEGGKYTILLFADGASLVKRYGEVWPAFEATGLDNLHIALARDLFDLRKSLETNKEENTK